MLPHILNAGDELLEKLFKDKSSLARMLIEERRHDIETGELSDDLGFTLRMMNTYDDLLSDEKITDILHDQEGSRIFHFGLRELKKMSVGELNVIQRWVYLEVLVNRRYQKQIDDKRRGDVKFGKTSIKVLKRQYEKVAAVWNDILSDDIMTPEELRTLAEAIHKTRIYSDDYKEFEHYVYHEVLPNGRVRPEETMKIYEYVVQILDVIKKRVERKLDEERNALKHET